MNRFEFHEEFQVQNSKHQIPIRLRRTNSKETHLWKIPVFLEFVICDLEFYVNIL